MRATAFAEERPGGQDARCPVDGAQGAGERKMITVESTIDEEVRAQIG